MPFVLAKLFASFPWLKLALIAGAVIALTLIYWRWKDGIRQEAAQEIFMEQLEQHQEDKQKVEEKRDRLDQLENNSIQQWRQHDQQQQQQFDRLPTIPDFPISEELKNLIDQLKELDQ